MERNGLFVLTMRHPQNAARRAARRLRAASADKRGIALQTVIIMVVLVVIAGAVAGVLINRAGQETGRLEDVDTTIDASKYGSKTLCEMADYTWLSGACTSGGGTPSGEGDGPALGTYRAQWTTDGGTTWVSTLTAKTAYDTCEAAGGADHGGTGAGPTAGDCRAQWSTDGGGTWTATEAAYNAGE